MGKALVFDGLVVSEPVAHVTFTDRIPGVIAKYVLKLSSRLNKTKVNALTTFYNTLNDAGIWNKIKFLYPMYGSVTDCAIGLVGEDIVIPSGATYDAGINLKDAIGGYGPKGNGILLYSFAGDVPDKYTAMSCTYKTINGNLNTLGCDSSDSPSDLPSMEHGRTSTTLRFVFDIDKSVENAYTKSCLIQTFHITDGYTASISESFYNGSSLGEQTFSGGGPTIMDNYKNWFLDGKATAPTTTSVGCNMIALFDSILSASEIATLSTAVSTLQDVLFA